MKILLSAFSCGATKTSEPGVAWRAVHHALGQGHEVWAIIQKSKYAADMKEHLSRNPLPRFHPVFFDLPSFLVKVLRQRGPADAVYYHLWQQGLLHVAQQLHARVGFDLAHHVTFARYWTPSGLRTLGVPFIWGPVGAAESAPSSFLAELPLRDRLFEFTRDTVRQISHLDPALRATARAATIAIGTTRETCEAMTRLGARRVEQLPMALADEAIAFFDTFPPPPPGPFRVICLGRLLHWKGFHLAIRAFAIFARNHPQTELWIAGSGPFQSELEKTIAQTGMGLQVKLLGHLSHPDAMARLAQAHVLLHPALHENFPGACLEAIAAGRPVICLDIGGPAVQVTPETGFVIAATNPEESVSKLATALDTLANDRDLLDRMSANSRARVRQEFSMGRTGAVMNRFYAEAVASRGGL